MLGLQAIVPKYLKINKMNSLKLSSQEIQEMDISELIENDGGFIPLLYVAATAAFWGLAFYGSFKAGYDAAKS